MKDKVNCIVVIDKDPTHRFLAERAIIESDIALQYHFESTIEKGIEFIREYRQEHTTCPAMIFLDIKEGYETETVLNFVDKYNEFDIQRRGKDGAIILMVQNPQMVSELTLRSGIKSIVEKPLVKSKVLEQYEFYKTTILRGSMKDHKK